MTRHTKILPFLYAAAALFAGCATQPSDPHSRVASWADDVKIKHDPYIGETFVVQDKARWGDEMVDALWFSALITDKDDPTVVLNLHHFDKNWAFFRRAVDRGQRPLPLSVDRQLNENTAMIEENMTVLLSVDYLRDAVLSGGIDFRLYGDRENREVKIGTRYILAFLEALRREGVDIGGPLTTANATYFAGVESHPAGEN